MLVCKTCRSGSLSQYYFDTYNKVSELGAHIKERRESDDKKLESQLFTLLLVTINHTLLSEVC